MGGIDSERIYPRPNERVVEKLDRIIELLEKLSNPPVNITGEYYYPPPNPPMYSYWCSRCGRLVSTGETHYCYGVTLCP